MSEPTGPRFPDGSRRDRFGAQLHATVASAAGPYGYTIALGGSTALATDRLGTPHLAGALLLMAGAVAAFVMLESLGARSRRDDHAGGEHAPPVWGNAHVPSAGASLCAVWATVHVVGGEVAWAATGLVATAVPFLVTAGQRVAAERWAAHRAGQRPDRARAAGRATAHPRSMAPSRKDAA